MPAGGELKMCRIEYVPLILFIYVKLDVRNSPLLPHIHLFTALFILTAACCGEFIREFNESFIQRSNHTELRVLSIDVKLRKSSKIFTFKFLSKAYIIFVKNYVCGWVALLLKQRNVRTLII